VLHTPRHEFAQVHIVPSVGYHRYLRNEEEPLCERAQLPEKRPEGDLETIAAIDVKIPSIDDEYGLRTPGLKPSAPSRIELSRLSGGRK
jgi:hypothetical protein